MMQRKVVAAKFFQLVRPFQLLLWCFGCYSILQFCKPTQTKRRLKGGEVEPLKPDTMSLIITEMNTKYTETS